MTDASKPNVEPVKNITEYHNQWNINHVFDKLKDAKLTRPQIDQISDFAKMKLWQLNKQETIEKMKGVFNEEP